MKEYASPTIVELRFHAEKVLTYSIENPGIETPTIPYNLPRVDLSLETK